VAWPLALVVLTLAACSGGRAPPDAPNVVLITVESLRVDHVGVYGGRSRSKPEVPVTPEIDEFAGAAVVYGDAHAVTSWTLASHASLFTGLYPSGHRTDGPLDRLDESVPTVADVLAAHGYQTAGVVSGPYLRRNHNLHQGFEQWEDSIASLTNTLAHDDVTNPLMGEALARFIDAERDPQRPFFLFAYFWDPHYDFLPPPPYDTMFVGPDSEPIDLERFDTSETIHAGITPGEMSYLYSQYAGELRWTDHHVGRLLRHLKERGLWENTLVILTADHGEEFFDHGEKGHKNNIHAETIHVPLIVKFPGQVEGRRDDRLVSHVDVLPTILDVTRTPVSFPIHGVSLNQPPPPDGRSILFELLSVWYLQNDRGERFSRDWRWRGVRRGDFKLVWKEEGGDGGDVTARLFDVRADPRELTDLASRSPDERWALSRSFEEGMRRVEEDAKRYPSGGQASLTPDEIERLRALGYLEP